MKAKLLIFAFLFLIPINVASAEVIRSFDVKINAKSDGQMEVNERILYDFEGEYRHGILREIPLYSKVGDLYRNIRINEVSVKRDGKDEKFDKYNEDENIVFKVGDKDKTITGPQLYEISYVVENGIGSNYQTHDEIYWNATGNNSSAIIEKASIEIVNDKNIKANRIACFTRSRNYSMQLCTYNPNELKTVMTTGRMYPGEGLTVVYGYPKGTYPESVLSKDPPSSLTEKLLKFFWDRKLYVWGILNILFPSLLYVWYQKKKNKKRYGKPAVNFEIPKDENGKIIPPALAGTIDNAKLDRDDVIATIFDLAIRKYIKLEEIKSKSKILGVIDKTNTQQQIRKLKNSDNELNSFEKKLFERLFKTSDVVQLKDLKKDFYSTFTAMENEAFKILVEKKYFVKNPKAQQGFLLVFALFSLISLNIILGISFLFLSKKLNGRTPLGDDIDFKIDGLKLFLNKMNRNYKWQADNFYTVEQMIPYAMSLGFIDKFMEQLKIIKPDYNPTWYHGYSGSFYSFYPSFYSSVSSNMTTSAPSSSSGFSSGSSGGGGGGGGVGSW